MISFQDASLEWLKRQGYHIIKTETSYWYDPCPKVFQAFPCNQLINPSNAEIKNFFKKNNALAMRFSSSPNLSEGIISYHVIYNKKRYELEDLPKKARHDVVKGLKYAQYEPITMSRLANEGWKLHHDTLIRQGRKNAESKNFWENLCQSAEGLSNFEAWGALYKGLLTAAIFSCSIGDTVNIMYQQSLSEHLRFGINNALIFTFTQEVLKRPEIRCIFYGHQSLDAPPSVDEFKFRMGYQAKLVKQRVVINPLISSLIKPYLQFLIKQMTKVFPSNCSLAKAQGMLGVYFKGKHSLTDQEYPSILKEHMDSVIQ